MSQPDQRAVILDMDLGIDDAIALLYLASRPNVSIEAAGSVHGNTPADLAAGNLRRVLALAGLPAVPVARGAHAAARPRRPTSRVRSTAMTASATPSRPAMSRPAPTPPRAPRSSSCGSPAPRPAGMTSSPPAR